MFVGAAENGSNVLSWAGLAVDELEEILEKGSNWSLDGFEGMAAKGSKTSLETLGVDELARESNELVGGFAKLSPEGGLIVCCTGAILENGSNVSEASVLLTGEIGVNGEESKPLETCCKVSASSNKPLDPLLFN